MTASVSKLYFGKSTCPFYWLVCDDVTGFENDVSSLGSSVTSEIFMWVTG